MTTICAAWILAGYAECALAAQNSKNARYGTFGILIMIVATIIGVHYA